MISVALIIISDIFSRFPRSRWSSCTSRFERWSELEQLNGSLGSSKSARKNNRSTSIGNLIWFLFTDRHSRHFGRRRLEQRSQPNGHGSCSRLLQNIRGSNQRRIERFPPSKNQPILIRSYSWWYQKHGTLIGFFWKQEIIDNKTIS